MKSKELPDSLRPPTRRHPAAPAPGKKASQPPQGAGKHGHHPQPGHGHGHR